MIVHAHRLECVLVVTYAAWRYDEHSLYKGGALHRPLSLSREPHAYTEVGTVWPRPYVNLSTWSDVELWLNLQRYIRGAHACMLTEMLFRQLRTP